MGWWKFFSHTKAKHDAIRLKDQRERRLFRHQTKAKRVPVKIPGPGHVNDGNESDDVAAAKSSELRHKLL
jgi:hypothetical protein